MPNSYDPFGGYASPKKAQAEAAANEVPSGLVKEILDWVGDDKERASRALEVENSHKKPRKGVVKELKELLSE